MPFKSGQTRSPAGVNLAVIPNAVEPADVISVEVSQHEQVDFSNTMAVEGRQKS